MGDEKFESPYEIDKKTRVSLEVVILVCAGVITVTWFMASKSTFSEVEQHSLARLETKVDQLLAANNQTVQSFIKLHDEVEQLQRDVKRIKRNKAPKWDEE